MKKYILIGLMLLSTPVFAAQIDGGCANGDGHLLTTGSDTTTGYCKSRTSMNWWSAHAWCKSIGKELVDLTKDCNIGKDSSTTVPCPYLASLGGSGWVWTAGVPGSNLAYFVDLSSGSLSDLSYRDNGGYRGLAALCRP